MSCPNKSHPVYKAIVAEYNEQIADEVYYRNGQEIPNSVEEAKKILATPQVKKGSEKQTIITGIRKSLLDSLKIQKAIYSSTKGNEARVERINSLIEKMESNYTVGVVVDMLSEANDYTTEAQIKMISILKKIQGGLDNMTQQEIAYLATETNEIKDLVSVYTILESAEQLFDKNDPSQAIISNVMARRRDLIRSFKKVHEEIVSHWLTNAAERVNSQLEASNKSEWKLSKDAIKRMLFTATADISFWEETFGAQANSKDPITGLVAAAVKEQAFIAQQEDIEFYNTVMEKYNAKGGPKDNPAAFNAEYVTDVEVYERIPKLDKNGKPLIDANGNPIYVWDYVKRKAFHQEYLYDQFEKDRRTFGKTVTKGIDLESRKAAAKKTQEWYEENTTLVDAQELIDRKKRSMSISEYNKWFQLNTKQIVLEEYPGGSSNLKFFDPSRVHSVKNGKIILYAGEFIRPNEKYKNPKFEKLKNDSYYMTLYNAYTDANDKLPITKQLKFGLLPQIRITGAEKVYAANQLTWENVKNDIKDSVNVTAYDSAYGLQTPSGAPVKFVPTMFTDYMLPTDELSQDLLRSTLMFSQMANNYQKMNEIQPVVALLTDMIQGNPTLDIDARRVQETTASGVPILRAITNNISVKRPLETRVNRTLLEFLDKVIYDEREIAASMELMGRNVSLNKVGAKLANYQALTSLAINLSAGINNTLFGQYSTAVEAIAGKYFNIANYADAQATYMGAIPGLLGDLANGVPTSKVGVLAMLYDAIQGEFVDEFGERVSGSALRRAFSTKSLFFLQKSGEHYIQVSGMIAMMKATKVKNAEGNEISLWDAYDENGKLKPGIKWTQKDQFAFMQKLHKMNKDLHGIYNKFDSPTIQRKWYGKLMMLFRKWIYTGMQRRFSSRYLDIEGGDIYQGYFNTFIRAITSDVKNMQFKMLMGQGMSLDEKQNMYRAYTDLLAWSGLMTVFLMISNAANDDDEENSWTTNMLMLTTRRMAGDIMFYVWPPEMWRITKSPTVAQTSVENMIELLGQLPNYSEQYERKSGIYEKGDYKIEKKFYDAMPILASVQRTLMPQEQLNIYNR